MNAPRRILAVVDLSARGIATAREAWKLAFSKGAQFAIGHVVDWDTGAGGFSMLTPPEIEDRLSHVVQRRLQEISDLIGAAKTQTRISFKLPRLGLSELLEGWQPDLLFVDAKLDFGLAEATTAAELGWPCAVRVVDHPADGFLPAKFFQSLATIASPR
jgi:hypothetical protein